MSYLADFQRALKTEDYQSFLTLWEEYCASDEVDGAEFTALLAMIAQDRFAPRFGPLADSAVLLWQQVKDEGHRAAVLRFIIDLQTSQSPEMAELAYDELQKKYGQDPGFEEKVRLVGLRNRIQFQGAIRHFELLNHLAEGRFVYHKGGWGTGEILEVSPVREELQVEFEAVPGKRTISFENAFHNLLPLADDHFLSRRFGDPDLLEEQARKDPVGVIQALLRDLGPKTAAEIKDELCEWVIPEEDWTKWWQSARSRLRKETRLETPSTLKEPFRLHREEVSHVERLKRELDKQQAASGALVTCYSYLRDFPEISKSDEGRGLIEHRIRELLDKGDLEAGEKLEAYALLEDLLEESAGVSFADAIKQASDVALAVNAIEIIAFKKRALTVLRQERADWPSLFLEFLFSVPQSSLRDYLYRELAAQPDQEALRNRFDQLAAKPALQPSLFLWYFHKVVRGDDDVLFKGKEQQCRFFEALLILLHQIELLPNYRELSKKIYGLITANRFALVRDVLAGSSIEFAREFLLLVSKSHTLTVHDVKILNALAEVAHPSLAEGRRETEEEKVAILWTTEAGYQKLRSRIEEIGTKEMIDNAREIETAREHGDLRENAEFKAAQERRVRLQAELKMLSDQLNQARILTAVDVNTDAVGVGTIVAIADAEGASDRYTLLGPWDADPDQHVLAFQSRFAQAMAGLKSGDTFSYQGKSYTVGEISSFFEQQLAS